MMEAACHRANRSRAMLVPKMKNAKILFCFLLSSFYVSAQILPTAKQTSPPPANEDPLDRDSPQSSVVAFLEGPISQRSMSRTQRLPSCLFLLLLF
jgi:hypothetical protein